MGLLDKINPTTLVGDFLDLGSQVIGNMMSANQAKKDRQFQERMYERQVEDNIKFWNMQNEYNLPSAVMQRMKDANINPYLAFEGGASAFTSSQQPAAAQAPHGSTAAQSMHTNFGLGVRQAQLMDAQIRNMNADSEQKEATAAAQRANESVLKEDYLLKRLTRDVNVAIRYRDFDYLDTSIRELSSRMYNEQQIRLQTVLTMMQGREYQIKQYNLNEWQVGQSIMQGWKQLEIGAIQASAAMKQAAAAWSQAVTAANIGAATVGEINQRIYQSRKLFPQLYRQAQNQTLSQSLDIFFNSVLRGLDISQKQVDIMKGKLQTIRVGLGNDSGLGSLLAPFQMPVGSAAGSVDERFNELIK